MVRKFHRLQNRALLAVATLCMALSGCGDESSAGGPKTEHPTEKLSAAQIVTVVATINQGEMNQAEATAERIEDEKVRLYIEKLLLDHRNAETELTKLMGSLALEQESSDLQFEVDELAQKLNRALEREQVKERIAPLFLDVQIRMHRKAIDAVDRMLVQAQQGELRTYLENFRATLKEHLNQAAKLTKQFPDREFSR